MTIHDSRDLLERRRELRSNQTKVEEVLWWYLRDRKMGVKFRRQHSLSGYILDFYCADKKIIIELDGEIHDAKEEKEYDVIRDKYFKGLGYIILRFKNREIENELEKILDDIQNCINKTKSRLKT
jgi:very-short-patch-repair endonuclease